MTEPTGRAAPASTLVTVHRVEIHHRADRTLRAEVAELAEATEKFDGVRFLSDHLWLDLQHGGADGFVAVVARDEHDGGPAAYAQASTANEGLVAESTARPDHDSRADAEQMVVGTLLAHIDRHGDGTPVTWWVHDVRPHHDTTAHALGLVATRDLYQMRRPLPAGLPVSVETRSFDPAGDEESWLAVNNRAFAGHGEQGGWNLATLRQRGAEPWFDADGFRIHERDGRMAAFCWTKLHHDVDPPLGEIYVIGVDPDFQGLGLGRQLTLAGLESIHRRGIDTAMLFVDAANTAAVALYRALGFDVHRTDRAFQTAAPA